MLDSTGERERERERLRWVFVDCDWSRGEFSPATSLQLIAVGPQSEEETGEWRFNANIRIRRDHFTRCVSLTFTVTVITS